MAEISASMVKELREMTGLGMMECKKALVEADGDLKKAEELLRIKSGAKASKAATRVAAEGIVSAYLNDSKTEGALVELNCETDFVAKNEDFIAFGKTLAQRVVETKPADLAALVESAEEERKALVMKLGENINVRRFERFETAGKLAVYSHGSKIGVLVNVSEVGSADAEVLGKDIAMHIAASKPVCVSKADVPADLIENERKIYTAQAAESGKPAEIIEKMVIGRINKYLAEVTLLGQPFVKNPDITVEKLLAEKGATIAAFTMFKVGEGIEKKVTDFAAEVRAQAGM